MLRCHVIAFVLAFMQNNVVWGQELNVYDKAMTNCGSDNAKGCEYSASDTAAHQVCVRKLPDKFSNKTGQGSWSDSVTGKPWCICIWAYSNYILHSGDLQIQCSSIPAKVLEEKYSLDKFAQCGSMSSKDGCGPEDIRRSIQSLCSQCKKQAPDTEATNALKTKCDAILAKAPPAPMGLLEVQSGVAFSASRPHSFLARP